MVEFKVQFRDPDGILIKNVQNIAFVFNNNLRCSLITDNAKITHDKNFVTYQANVHAIQNDDTKEIIDVHFFKNKDLKKGNRNISMVVVMDGNKSPNRLMAQQLIKVTAAEFNHMKLNRFAKTLAFNCDYSDKPIQ